LIRAAAALLALAVWASAGEGRAPPSGAKPGMRFTECAQCPEMVVIPAGTFTIGSPADEPGRAEDEGPQRTVRIARPFAAGRFEITRGQYEAFVRATKRPVGGGCITDRRRTGDWQPDERTSLRDPGFAQTDRHPVVCVNWDEAKAFIAWLNDRTSGGYRLPTEAEWEYLTRAGTTRAYPWGTTADTGCAFMNGTDATFRTKYPTSETAACNDGRLNTASVGSYKPNAFGLHDMIGNTGEWIEDCVTATYADLPPDGTAAKGDCAKRMVRGGSWGTIPRQLRSAERIRYAPDTRDDSIGIRVVKTLP